MVKFLSQNFLLESYKEDVAASVIPVGAYATSVHRKLFVLTQTE